MFSLLLLLLHLTLLLQAVDKWVFERDEMRDLLLSDREWKFLEQLGSVLEVSLLRRSDLPVLI